MGETGGEIWDPLGISNAVSDEAMMWFRAAELKHGRAAMLGSVGYLIGAAGITFPGEIAKGVSFASVNSDGVYNAWAKVPEEGKLQILCLLLALETANESKKPHYMRGGVPGRIDSLPFDRAAGDDRHGLVPHRPQPARLRPRPHLGVLNNPDLQLEQHKNIALTLCILSYEVCAVCRVRGSALWFADSTPARIRL